MEPFVIYNLKVGACLVAFYLFYKLLLSHDTFHRLNRVLLLLATIAAFVLPVCTITIERELPTTTPTHIESNLTPVIIAPTEELEVQPSEAVEVAAPSPFPWGLAIEILFITGAIVTLGGTLRSLIGIARVIRRGRQEPLDGSIILSRQNTPITPFSWMRWIVISNADYAENGTTILAHERAHIAYGHSIDLLVTDLLSCLQWFNPAMWLLRRELRTLHEYEADAAVLTAGTDAQAYQLLLIKKAVGGRWYSVANSLNHSNLKNRITMMLRKKSSRWAGAKALFVLPLLGIALGAFAQTTYVASDDKGREKSTTEKTFSGGMSVASEGEGRLQILVDGKGDALMGAASLTYYNTILNTLQDSTTSVLNAPLIHLLIAALDDTDAQALGYVKPMILINGQPLASDATVPDASCITSMIIRDYTQGKAAYGTEGANGVIAIKTKRPDEPSFDFAEALRTRETDEMTNRICFWGNALQLKEINDPKGPTFTMSGSLTSNLISKKESEADLARNQEEMDKTPVDWQFVGKIVAHHNEMGEVVVDLSGAGDAMMAASGLLSYYQNTNRMLGNKEYSKWIPELLYRLSRCVESVAPGMASDPLPLCLINGKQISQRSQVPDARHIAQLVVLDKEQGKAAYGIEGAEGAVLITLKKANESTLPHINALLAADYNHTKTRSFSCGDGTETEIKKGGYFANICLSQQTIVLIDGHETNLAAFEALDKTLIRDCYFAPSEATTEQYGARGKYGVLRITTKKLF